MLHVALLLCLQAYMCLRQLPVGSAMRCRALAMLLRGGDVQSAAILTPYNGQVRELQRCFHRNKELAPYEGMVDISSVDGYQVQSTTRSPHFAPVLFVCIRVRDCSLIQAAVYRLLTAHPAAKQGSSSMVASIRRNASIIVLQQQAISVTTSSALSSPFDQLCLHSITSHMCDSHSAMRKLKLPHHNLLDDSLHMFCRASSPATKHQVWLQAHWQAGGSFPCQVGRTYSVRRVGPGG